MSEKNGSAPTKPYLNYIERGRDIYVPCRACESGAMVLKRVFIRSKVNVVTGYLLLLLTLSGAGLSICIALAVVPLPDRIKPVAYVGVGTASVIAAVMSWSLTRKVGLLCCATCGGYY